jgi:putative nucleotidyltransferase with HDIG domain
MLQRSTSGAGKPATIVTRDPSPAGEWSCPADRISLIGRHSDNQIRLGNPLISRRHARIFRDKAGRWVLEDLESRNGTFVNEGRVHGKRHLANGDEIRFADVCCTFLADETPGEAIGSDGAAQENNVYTEFFSLAQSEFLPEKQLLDTETLRRDYEKLRITYELQKDIGSDFDIDSILTKILERIFEFLDYDQAVILLVDNNGSLRPQAHKCRRPGTFRGISSTLIGYVKEKKMGVISLDVLTDSRFQEAASMITRGARSSMAAPIIHDGDLLGAIIIESFENTSAFSEKDLRLITSIAGHVAQFIRNSLLHEEMQRFFDSAITTLSAMIDARHPLTAGHSERVARYALMIGRQMGLAAERLEGLRLAALLHDIGKIGIPNRILLKQGKFTAAEREKMNEHPVITRKILEKFHFPKHLRWIPQVTALHHEKCNGQGYPRGLTCTRIPLEAKILALADVFDALTSPRDYPKYNAEGKVMDCDRMPLADVLAIIEKESGEQFDARVVCAFRKCVAEALLLYRGTHFPPDYVDDVLQEMNADPPQASLRKDRGRPTGTEGWASLTGGSPA